MREIIAHHFNDTAAQSIWQALSTQPGVLSIAGHPLLLSILIRVIQEEGKLPRDTSDLYATWMDTFLRQWDKTKGIQPPSDWGRLASIYSELALSLMRSGRHSFRFSESLSFLDFPQKVPTPNLIEVALEWGLQKGLLTQTSPGTHSFTHSALQEYFAAMALVERSVRVAADAATRYHLVELLTHITSNPDELALELLKTRKFTELIDILRGSAGIGAATRRKVVEAIVSEIGPSGTVPPDRPGEGDGRNGNDEIPWEKLRGLWEACDKTTTKHEKGLALEEFAEAFFGLVFKVVEKRLNTDAGEVDLVCEHKKLSAFWIRWASDVFIECKNHEDRTPVSDMNAFLGKCATCKAKLAFFLSRSGFTTVATGSLARSWGNSELPDIVWIGGQDVESWLAARFDPEEFLKRMCRRANYGPA